MGDTDKSGVDMIDHARSRRSGQATVEFALASTVFMLLVFGALDFGRAIFISAELHNAVREGSRYGTMHPTDDAGIRDTVVNHATGTGLTTAGVTTACPSGCVSGRTVTVSASVPFSTVTQNLLGIPALTLGSSASREIE
jgi:Flp pilus assembly protein TadG